MQCMVDTFGGSTNITDSFIKTFEKEQKRMLASERFISDIEIEEELDDLNK